MESNHEISDLIEQPKDLSPIQITKTSSRVSLPGNAPDTDGMPPVETVAGPGGIVQKVNASVEQLDVKETQEATVGQSLQSLAEECTVEDVSEASEVPMELVDASIGIVVQAFEGAGKNISETDALASNEKTGNEENNALASNEKTGSEENNALASNEKTGNEENNALASNEKTGNEENNALASNEKTGNEENNALASNEKTGNEENNALASNEKTGSEENNDYDPAIYSSSSTHLCAHLSQKILETSRNSIKDSTSAESSPDVAHSNSTPAMSAPKSALSAKFDPSTTTLEDLFYKTSITIPSGGNPAASDNAVANKDGATVTQRMSSSIAMVCNSVQDQMVACEAGCYVRDAGAGPKSCLTLGAPKILNVMSYQSDDMTKSVQFSATNVEHEPVSPRAHPADNRTPEERKAERKALEENIAACGVKVYDNLNDSLKTLEKDFVQAGSSSRRSDSIQNIGNSILENDIKESKRSSQGSIKSSISSFAARSACLTEKQLHEEIARLETALEESKQEISSYQRELERMRASGDDILELCNELAIDPAIATVQNLLHMMQKVRTDMEAKRLQNISLTEKLQEQTTLMAEQEYLIERLGTKLTAQDSEDDHRVEDKCDEIFEYYEVKLEGIQEQLAKMNVKLHSDFWVPHAHTLSARLKEIRSHKRAVAEESLLHAISNTETDKYDSNDNLDNSASRGIFTSSEKTIIPPNQIGNHGKYKVENDVPRNMNSVKKGSNSCVLQ